MRINWDYYTNYYCYGSILWSEKLNDTLWRFIPIKDDYRWGLIQHVESGTYMSQVWMSTETKTGYEPCLYKFYQPYSSLYSAELGTIKQQYSNMTVRTWQDSLDDSAIMTLDTVPAPTESFTLLDEKGNFVDFHNTRV